MNDEGLADVEAASPFRLPRLHPGIGFRLYIADRILLIWGARPRHRRDQGARRAAGRQQWPGPHGPGDRGGREQLRELYGRLKRFGARVEFTTDHVLTKSVHFFDPDGNPLEIFSQELSSASAKQYLHEAQAAADVMRPLDLETATSTGQLRAEGRFASWGVMPRGMHQPPPFPSSFGHQSQTANAV